MGITVKYGIIFCIGSNIFCKLMRKLAFTRVKVGAFSQNENTKSEILFSLLRSQMSDRVSPQRQKSDFAASTNHTIPN